jgi:two-component system, LytTR family, response regulator
MIRALIADDESLAREGLRRLLENEAGVEIVGECVDGRDAVQRIEEVRPDLLFLDIQMPEADGFDVLRAVGVATVPAVVFVTAYDRHALEAFEVHAVDYLLKPVSPDRFAVAMERTRRMLGASPGDPDAALSERQRIGAMLAALERASRTPDRLVVRIDGRTLFLQHTDIDRIEADGNYARVVVRGRALLVRETLGQLEEQLDPHRFIRIHRSTIVNIDRIREVQSMFKGDQVVVMTDGGRFSLSRKYRALLEARLGKRI